MKKSSMKPTQDNAAASRLFAALAELTTARRTALAPTPLLPNARACKKKLKNIPAHKPVFLN